MIQGRTADCLVGRLIRLQLFAYAGQRVEEYLRHQRVAVKQSTRAQRLHMSRVRRHQRCLSFLKIANALKQDLSALLPREPEVTAEYRRNGKAFATELLRLLDRVVNRKLQ